MPSMKKPDDTGSAVVHVPHSPLNAYYASEEERSGYLKNIFDNTACDYDRIEQILAIGSGPWYRGQALVRAGLVPGMRVLDVGVGTGLVAREAARIVGDPALVTGIDPSNGMMDHAHVPEGVTLLAGRAEDIPLEDSSVDFLSMGYALRHVSDLSVAFNEFHRVLKPGGRICLLEISRPESRLGRLMLKAYMRGFVPAIARLVSGQRETIRLWRYYWDTIDACASPAQVLHTLRTSGFSDARRHVPLKALNIFSEYQATRAVGDP